MKRYLDYTLDELIEIEADWWDREDETNPKWIKEGLSLFLALSKLDRKNSGYLEVRAYLSILHGEYLKIQDRSYERAIKVFHQIIKLELDNARAHYRLGFLYFYEGEWTKSLDAFYQAAHSNPNLTRKKLTAEQMVKAHYYILKNSKIITQACLDQIDDMPYKQLEQNEELKLILDEIRNGIEPNEEIKPYQMIKNGVEYSDISEEEYEMQSNIELPMLIFNQISLNDTEVSYKGKSVAVPLRSAAILEYLMKNPNGVTSQDVISRLSQQSKAPEAALRQIISRLRRRLAELNPNIEFIETIDGGYRWSWVGEYWMFKHFRCVGTELQLD
ncbi:winged helix-turn-helix domain-containing protein [Alkalihalophilus marmarensis]|jgi:tetratricopeptide (TPR) repeat protein|uniref:winged helix-turn-helix domain-containing protein n=1 Tax=Alkalihalophilus marmarensis TaxID=521377 RepID=UPI0020406C72|nr:winged helix-turn-helix domain-containing protein [Alkalihalophilus marmarensis]MCM3491175.1 winged helix-turn-helix domain-containing protein [Alkalihalophilus marmarensis]